MPEHYQYEDRDLFNPETQHEQSDVPVKPLWWALGIFVVFAVISHFVLWGMYKFFVATERGRMDPPQTAVARPGSADIPQNQPLLQPFPLPGANGDVLAPTSNTPVTDLVHMRAAEEKVLTTYGWVDRERGIIHIPIEVAKERMAARIALEGQTGGMTATTDTAAPATTTDTAAAEEQP
jgi:hypothetical protein